MDDHPNRPASYDTPARRAMLQSDDREPWPQRGITILGVVIVGLLIGAILGIALR